MCVRGVNGIPSPSCASSFSHLMKAHPALQPGITITAQKSTRSNLVPGKLPTTPCNFILPKKLGSGGSPSCGVLAAPMRCAVSGLRQRTPDRGRNGMRPHGARCHILHARCPFGVASCASLLMRRKGGMAGAVICRCDSSDGKEASAINENATLFSSLFRHGSGVGHCGSPALGKHCTKQVSQLHYLAARCPAAIALKFLGQEAAPLASGAA